jgi:hypothetical protein
MNTPVSSLRNVRPHNLLLLLLRTISYNFIPEKKHKIRRKNPFAYARLDIQNL